MEYTRGLKRRLLEKISFALVGIVLMVSFTSTIIQTRPQILTNPPGPAMSPTRYVLYDSTYGSLNNQLNSLIAALTIARRLGAVTVVGPATSPGGNKLLRGDQGFGLHLVPDFFDSVRLNSKQPVVTWQQFSNTTDGQLLASPHFARYYSLKPPELDTVVPKFYNRLLGLWPEFYELNTTNWTFRRPQCELIFDRAEFILDQCGTHASCRFILLDQVFTNYHDCSVVDPYWRELRTSLVPSEYVQRTVDDFVRDTQGPLITAHVRYDGGVDGEADQFWKKFSAGLDKALNILNNPDNATLYVLGMKKESEKYRVDNTIDYLKKNWVKQHPQTVVTIVTCVNITNCGESGRLAPWAERIPGPISRHLFQPRMLTNDSNNHFGTILLEQWLSVASDVYVGRWQSTFSQNVFWWREVVDLRSNETVVSY